MWDRPITPRQLARFLQVSPRTVSRLTKTSTFPRIAVNGQMRFVPNDVLEFLRKKS
jgi:predicted DNA-binding transcriptional regulator AlpA